MREPTRFLLCLLVIFCSSFYVEKSGSFAIAALVEETCTSDQAGEDGTCASPLDDEDSSDDEDEHPLCQDDDESCTVHASQGACAENPGYMTYHCPRSCNTCEAVQKAAEAAEFVDEGGGGVCKDDHFQCLEWAQMGECDANPGYMLINCKRACVVCYGGTNQFGVGQRMPTKPDEAAKTAEYVKKTVEYMKRVWKEEEFSRVRHKCRNQHEDCTFWASLGECEANPKYMQTNCAPACETCHLLDIKHRCPIEPGNECIWKPGDLNTLMENIADNADGSGEYLQYNPKALSRPMKKRDGTDAGVDKDGPWIVLLENFVSEEEADRLVELGKKQGYERSADVGKERPDGSHDSKVSDSRTSYNTWCQEPSCYEDPLVKPVIDRIANITKTEVRNSEYLQLLQYEPGQYYRYVHSSMFPFLWSNLTLHHL